MRISDFGYPIVPSQSKRKEELLGEFLLRARRRSGVTLCVWVSWCERRDLNSRFVCVMCVGTLVRATEFGPSSVLRFLVLYLRDSLNWIFG